jgi:hypothetical protein
MESSLPALALPVLSAMAMPPTDASPSGNGAGFGAMLGAAKLTPDLQQALADLLTAVVPGVAIAGNGLPGAAILGLGKDMALPLSPPSSEDAQAGEATPGIAGLPVELAALLALLQSAPPGADLTNPPIPSDPPMPSMPEEMPVTDPAALAAGLGNLLAQLGASFPPSAEGGNGNAALPAGDLRGQRPLAAVVARLQEGFGRGAQGLPVNGVEQSADPPATAVAPTHSLRDALPQAGLLLALRAANPTADGPRGESSGPEAVFADELAEAASVNEARPVPGIAAEVSAGRPRAAATVVVPFGDRGWERALGEKVVWLVGQQVQAAEVKLNPPHLGPVEFRLTLNGNEASVSFTAANAAVREAIEQALPRLREMLAEQNLVMVGVDVGQRGGSGQAEQREAGLSPGGSVAATAGRDGDAPVAEPPLRRLGASGLVDEYA